MKARLARTSCGKTDSQTRQPAEDCQHQNERSFHTPPYAHFIMRQGESASKLGLRMIVDS